MLSNEENLKQVEEVKEMISQFTVGVQVLAPELEKAADALAPLMDKLVSKMFFQGQDLKSLTTSGIATQICLKLVEKGGVENEKAAQLAVDMAKTIVAGAFK